MNASDFFTPEYVALLKLIQKGDRAKAELAVKQGLSLNIHGEEGITPLFWLILKNNLPAIKLALELGADPNFAAGDGRLPLIQILGGEKKHDPLVKLLLDYGANPNAKDLNGAPALFRAVGGDSLSQIDLLLSYGANINLKDKSHTDSALYASYLNKFEIVHYLIGLGIDYTNRADAGDDIAWGIHHKLSNNLLNPEFSAYGWALKVKALLESKGVTFPPPSPQEIRAQRAKEKSNQ